jgi:hypothetical protein
LRAWSTRAWPVAAVAIAAVLLTLCAAAGWAGSELLGLLPALLLGCLLLMRRFPGERSLIARLGAHGRGRRRRPVAGQRVHERVIAVAVRGTLLMGRSLAVRPPPQALAS